MKQIFYDKNSELFLYCSIMKFLVKPKTLVEIENKFKEYSNELQNDQIIKRYVNILEGLNLIKKTKDKYLLLIPDTFINGEENPACQGNSECVSIILNEMHDNVRQMEEKFMFSYSNWGKYKRPKNHLEDYQKKIKCILSNHLKNEFPIHEVAKAYVKGGSIVKNVEEHLEKNFILKLDFQCFFNSIKKEDFYNFLKSKSKLSTLGLEEKHIDLICDICFKDSSLEENSQCLPIGATTSPLVSNIILYQLDEKLSEYCKQMGISYTRYSDDLTFSHNEKGQLNKVREKVESFINSMSYLNSLIINDKKILYMSKKGRRKVTGLYLTPQGKISIGRKRKNYINKLFRDYEKTEEAYPNRIKGHLNFIKSVEKDFFDRLYKKWVTNGGHDKFKHLF